MMSQIPDGCDPQEIYKRIESFLENLGYRGELNIWAYKGNNSIPDDEVISRFRDARINFKHDGTERIVVDTSEKGGHPGTGLFWDVGDYPIPTDLDAELIYLKIGNALCDKHLLGVKVTVMAYGEKNQMFRPWFQIPSWNCTCWWNLFQRFSYFFWTCSFGLWTMNTVKKYAQL